MYLTSLTHFASPKKKRKETIKKEDIILTHPLLLGTPELFASVPPRLPGVISISDLLGASSGLRHQDGKRPVSLYISKAKDLLLLRCTLPSSSTVKRRQSEV